MNFGPVSAIQIVKDAEMESIDDPATIDRSHAAGMEALRGGRDRIPSITCNA